MVGSTPAFHHLIDLIELVGPSDSTVLLLGESGTGKELAAHAVHTASPRHNQPFVTVDCVGLTDTLFESELFGHEKGAFTGALNRKIGLVEVADGGTLFLDEIGDVPLGMQVRLLRLLESGSFRRVGSVETRQTNFRLVAATHRDLQAMIRRGEFRSDLYYRLSAFPIDLPSLRERKESIALLAESLLARFGRPAVLSPEALARLKDYPFPGNIRELRNILERASLLCKDQIIRPEDLPPEVRVVAMPVPAVLPAPVPAPFLASSTAAPDDIIPLDEAERRYLRWALARHQGDRQSLADKLGVCKRTLYRKLREMGEED